MLSPQAVKEFKEIYREETGLELSDDKALELATQLIGFFEVIYLPSPLRKIERNKNAKQPTDEVNKSNPRNNEPVL